MSWNRKAAVVLLALVVFVTAVPAFACFLSSAPAGHACCRHMAMQCGSMGTRASCCQPRPADPASTPAAVSSTDQLTLHAVPFALHAALLPAASAASRTIPAAEAPPPRFSPGASTSLRI